MDGPAGWRRAELPEYVSEMPIREEIISLLTDYGYHGQKRFDFSDIFVANGIEGDEANELVDDFAKRFDVDMTRFYEHDYFHYVANEPPGHRRVLPIDIHGKVLPFIPVSIDMLAASAEAGKWNLSYPEHTVRTSLRSRLALPIFTIIFVGALSAYLWTSFNPT
jgi:hypothetical protein